MSTPQTDADHRLRQLLGGDALAAFRRRARRAYEQAAAGGDPVQLRVGPLQPGEADALQGLAGIAPRTTQFVSVDLAALGRQLSQAGLARDLRDALERLEGPIAARAVERAAAQAAWSALAARPSHPSLAALLLRPDGLGLVKRLAASDWAAAASLCEQATRVLAALPSAGCTRASLAARWLGDAHALDDGRPVATLVLAALRLADDLPSAEDRRSLWATQGVAVNELARPALGLNLPADGLDADGEPRHWSLRLLLRGRPRWQVAGRDVFVCENPNLMAAVADTLGRHCAPMVCVEGQPAAAQRSLLQQLRDGGARLHYHGDFDWPGIQIANWVQQDFGARPWRMAAADYLAAAADTVASGLLAGRPLLARWDPGLTEAMRDRGRAVAEESLLARLLPDLRA